MTRPAVLQQLYGVRLVLDGVIRMVEEELAAAEGAVDEEETLVAGTCPHPTDRQVDATVMGEPPSVLCLDCGVQRLGVVPAQ